MATIKTIKSSAINNPTALEEDIWPVTSTKAVQNDSGTDLDTLLNTITDSVSKKLSSEDATKYYGPLEYGYDIDGNSNCTLEDRVYAIEEMYSDYLSKLTFMDDLCGTSFSNVDNGVKLQIQVNTRGLKGNGVCWTAKDTGTAIIPLATQTSNGVMSSADKTKLDSIEGDTTPLSEKGIVVPFNGASDSSVTITSGKCPVNTFTAVKYSTQKNVFYVTASRKNYTSWDANSANTIPSSDIYNVDASRAKHIFRDSSQGISYYFVYSATEIDSMHYYTLEELREVTINLPELNYPCVLPFTGILNIIPTIQTTSTASVDGIYYIYVPNSDSIYNKTFVARKDNLYYMSWSTQYHNNHEYNTHPFHNMYAMYGSEMWVVVDTGEMVELSELTNYY